MATSLALSECTLQLPPGWVSARGFEVALLRCGNALGGAFNRIVIRIPANCKLMIDVVIRLLSFCNQLAASTLNVRLEFASGAETVMSYLSRMGFFGHLSREAEVAPYRPTCVASQYRGSNQCLVEIERFNRSEKAEGLPNRLGEAVGRGCAGRQDVGQAANAVANIFTELMENVREHSGSDLDAYAALQTYPRGNRATIAVSDSGLGLMETLRPALARRYSPLAALGETELLVEIFRHGISSLDDDKRGLGLASSAQSAMRFKANLDVRLPHQRVYLTPNEGIYRPSTAASQQNLPLLWGTHIGFSMELS